ncbi:MAG: response regulator [Gemmatimonas sp.]|nr:response regulator [Gemmatimonas sp.]
MLLVEDNETIRNAFAVLLRESGYVVEQAASGADALARAAEMDPDLILMDLGLPDMNGLEVTRRLKKDPATARARVIAITGRALETAYEACIAAGCSAYVAKPVDTRLLLRIIEEELGKARLEKHPKPPQT